MANRIITGSLYIFQTSWFNLNFLSNLERVDGAPGSNFIATRPTLYIVWNYLMTTLSLTNLRSLGGTNIYIQDNPYLCLQDTVDWLAMVDQSQAPTFQVYLNFTLNYLTSADAVGLQLAGLPPLYMWTNFIKHPTLCSKMYMHMNIYIYIMHAYMYVCVWVYIYIYMLISCLHT